MVERFIPSHEAPFEGYMTVRAAVNWSGYSDQYLRRLMRDRIVEGVKVGHLWLVTVESLQAYLDKTRRTSMDDKRFGPQGKGGDASE